jgi:hypothetical protein
MKKDNHNQTWLIWMINLLNSLDIDSLGLDLDMIYNSRIRILFENK